ncbi:MAG: 2-isopropylmalate synthase [Proteobacteria bacterium]|nr:2-isopropylmalate synthase [Pseudomonadota bacterium]
MLELCDSTLREGEQTPGVYFPGHAKLAIATLLDRLGVHYIEAGRPAVSAEAGAEVRSLCEMGYRARIACPASPRTDEVTTALGCGVQLVGVSCWVAEQRSRQIHDEPLDQTLEPIVGVIELMKKSSPRTMIRLTVEDAVRSPFERVVEASLIATQAGADMIGIADTTGCAIPGTEQSLYVLIRRLRERLDARGCSPRLSVHCHNDRGLALVNALDAYRAGVDVVDVSVMGLGERAGIVDLAQCLATLAVDFSACDMILTELPELYRMVSKYSGVTIPHNAPIMGKYVFTHCAGVHSHAAIVDASHYQSLEPAMFGRKMTISLDHMSGLSSVRHAVEQLEVELNREQLALVLSKVKEVGRHNRTVDLEELRHIVTWCLSKDSGSV